MSRARLRGRPDLLESYQKTRRLPAAEDHNSVFLEKPGLSGPDLPGDGRHGMDYQDRNRMVIDPDWNITVFVAQSSMSTP